MDPNAINQILPLLLQQYQTANNSQKSFADMLKERRGFVQGAENGTIDQAQGAIQNGSNGVSISPAAMDTPALSYHTDNANKTAALTQQMFGFGQQANDVLKSIADLGNNAADRALQQRGQNLQYGIGDANGNTSSTSSAPGQQLNGAQAVTEVTRQGGSDILGQVTDDVSKRRLAAEVLAAGGVAAYRKSSSDPAAIANRDGIAGTNTTLQAINRIQDRLQNSKNLQNVLNDPFAKLVANLAISSHNQQLLSWLKLNDNDVAALGDLVSLNASGDRQLIGGRLTGYLSNRLSPAQPGLDKSASQNLTQVGILKKNIQTSLDNYAKQFGYKSANDIPGIDHSSHANGSVMMKSPDGKTYKIDSAEVKDAVKNGWKQL